MAKSRRMKLHSLATNIYKRRTLRKTNASISSPYLYASLNFLQHFFNKKIFAGLAIIDCVKRYQRTLRFISRTARVELKDSKQMTSPTTSKVATHLLRIQIQQQHALNLKGNIDRKLSLTASQGQTLLFFLKVAFNRCRSL